MKKLVMLVGMATFAIMMSMSFPSVVQADTITIQALLSPMLLTELRSENMSEQPTEHRSSWGAVKEMYRGVNPVPYSAERAESTAAVNRRGTIQPYSIGSSRYFVRNECWYALDQNWLYRGDDVNGPGVSGSVSRWHWLSKAADAGGNGLRAALQTYQTCVTNEIPSYCRCCDISTFSLLIPGRNSIDYWVSYLSSDAYAVREGIGRGAQCVSFVTMVIYRATGGRVLVKWDWNSNTQYNHPAATGAQVGDIVYYNYGLNNQHVAICVRRTSAGITIVDSNRAGYEMIGRLDISNAELASKWRYVSGSGAGGWY